MLFLVTITLLYFLPSIIGRDKSDFAGIFLVNFLLGWTVIGWCVALVWACSAERAVPVRYVPVSSGRFCSHCGTLGPVGAHYCSSCGRAI
ncbi:MAG TPA: superinfection immunity protein [Terriglobales bacterium]|nr:superinfection immunity protein [Terriglobales bacterium]